MIVSQHFNFISVRAGPSPLNVLLSIISSSNPHDVNQSTNLRSQIDLDSHPFGGDCQGDLRSEIGRFGLIVRIGGLLTRFNRGEYL